MIGPMVLLAGVAGIKGVVQWVASDFDDGHPIGRFVAMCGMLATRFGSWEQSASQ